VANETKNYSAGTNVQVNFNKTITSFGQSVYNISCRNNYTIKNTTNNLFWVDIIAPNAIFSIPNKTAYYSGNISFTLNASDETELFSINVTIDSIPLYYNSSVNGSSYLVNIIYPSENLTTGIHIFYATVKDGGTDYKLKQEYSTKKGFFSDFITYEYAGGAYTMKLKDSAITDQWISEKKLDRFSQTIKPSKNKGNSITLLETSTSKMHIETGKIGSKHGNMWIVTEDGHWRDFRVKNEPASFVERINFIDDYTAEIVVSGIINMEEIVLESFGEINSITKTLSVYKGQAVMAYSSSATIELPQTHSLNVTVDWDYVNFISANYTYNGTLKTVSVSNGSSYLLYTTTSTAQMQEVFIHLSGDLT
jgi:hypothetical protein